MINQLYYRASKIKTKLNDVRKKEKKQSLRLGQITKLDPTTIPKFENELVKPPVFEPLKKVNKGKNKMHLYYIDISEFQEQILPTKTKQFPKTTVWGYGGLIKDPKTKRISYFRNSPGPTFEAVSGIPVKVKWINKLKGQHPFAVDPTLHWANPNNMPMDPPERPPFPPGFPKAQKPVPVVTHLHGGEVPSIYDGHPDAWFTYDGKKGPAFVTSKYTYPNKQEPTTLWYHDHALGITRLNVYAGLAGFYLLREPKSTKHDCNEKQKLVLPKGDYEIPIVIQDRCFNTDGSLWFPNVGNNPEIHPYWAPEFFGDTIMVNGKVWPNLNVERRQYRFRLLNGSSARFYNLRMSNADIKFIQIGTDGGFLREPAIRDTILMAPGERADILVDFSKVTPGTKIILLNDAPTPFPMGDPVDPNTDPVGQIMQFTVPKNAAPPVTPAKLPDKLNCINTLIPDSKSCQRILTLNEVMGPNDTPIAVLLNGQKWEAPISENPRVGTTEEWVIANLTMDTHPIHLHLVQFQLLNRQKFRAEDYTMDWLKLNGDMPLDHPTNVLSVNDYLDGDSIKPDNNEKGWKDTVRMNPGQVTRIRVRFAPQAAPDSVVKPGRNLYPFDPTRGPGYVWHCHILDHEDNEMMRPYKVKL